jgi:hypothetical protein
VHGASEGDNGVLKSYLILEEPELASHLIAALDLKAPAMRRDH